MSGGKGAEYTASTIIFLSTAKLKSGREDELDLNSTGVVVTATAKKNRFAKTKKVKFEIDHEYGTNRYKGLEYFCTPQNFEKVGICKGKRKDNPDGTIGIEPGGTRWYVRHLDKNLFEKQLFNKEVFNTEVLEALDGIIYKYFEYSSFDDMKTFDESDDEIQTVSSDSDFDEIEDDELF
jgi:hypothetical protein